MSDKAKFSHSDFPNDKKLSIGINAKKNSNLQEWLEVLPTSQEAFRDICSGHQG